MTVGHLLEIQNALNALCGLDLPVREALKLARLKVRVDDEARPYHAVHDDIVRKLAGGGAQLTPEDKKWPTYLEERQKLIEEELDLELDPVVLPADALPAVSGMVMAPLVGLVEVE